MPTKGAIFLTKLMREPQNMSGNRNAPPSNAGKGPNGMQAASTHRALFGNYHLLTKSAKRAAMPSTQKSYLPLNHLDE